MKNGHLSRYFSGVAGKRLSAVEINTSASNQHEFQVITAMAQFLGYPSEPTSMPTTFIYFSADGSEPLIEDDSLTVYDARRKSTTRPPEYRAYYRTTAVSEAAREGDLLIIARLRDSDRLLAVIAEDGSTEASQLEYLFGFSPSGRIFNVRSEDELGSSRGRIGFAAQFILEGLGIYVEPEDEAGSYLKALLDRFGNKFPDTRAFSAYARGTLPGADPAADPDGTLIAWAEQEERLFRILERHLLREELQKHFPDGITDIDLFLQVSLSVQNRRKSRAGHSLEHHVAEILLRNGVRFDQGAQTENRSKPDFLFPSAAEYCDPGFPAEILTMLGVKSTLKDRWRQVLAEADRIRHKHLLTLQPGISDHQITEMKANDLQLVVPAPLHATFSSRAQEYLLSLARFISIVKEKQDSGEEQTGSLLNR